MSSSPAALPFPQQKKIFRSINRLKFVPPPHVMPQQHAEANNNNNEKSPVCPVQPPPPPPPLPQPVAVPVDDDDNRPVSENEDDDEVCFIKAFPPSPRRKSQNITQSPARASPTTDNIQTKSKPSPIKWNGGSSNDKIADVAAAAPKTTANHCPTPPPLTNQANHGINPQHHQKCSLSSPLPLSGRLKPPPLILSPQRVPAKRPVLARIVDSQSKCSYELGEYMGKGAFARCYAVRSQLSGEVLACKMIPQAMLKKPEIREKVYQEIIIHRSLSHEFVVGFRSNFEDSSYVYMMLELCEKRSLMELQRKRVVITEPEAKYFLKQIVTAVEYIHGQKVIHRDLKLGNVFITKDIRLKIGDFGLATRVDSVGDRKASLCGTPNYIAPEVLAKTGHSYEVDIWSIGCILYTLLVGRPPFETGTLRDTYRKIRRAEYQRPRIEKTSKGALDLIEQTLQLCPSKRPTPAQILKSEFFKSGILPTSLPQSVLTTAPKFARNYDIITIRSSCTNTKTTSSCSSSGSSRVAVNGHIIDHFAITESDGSFVSEMKDAFRVISKRHHQNGINQQPHRPQQIPNKKPRIEVIDISDDDKVQVLTDRSNNPNNHHHHHTLSSPARRSLIPIYSNNLIKHKQQNDEDATELVELAAATTSTVKV